MHSADPIPQLIANRLPGVLALVCVGVGIIKLLDGYFGANTGSEFVALIWLFGSFGVGALVYLLGHSMRRSVGLSPAMPGGPQLSSDGIQVEVVDTLAQSVATATRSSEKVPDFSLALLLSLDDQRFARLCHAYFREKGIHSEPTSESTEWGFDIRIFQDTSNQPQVIVQCRAGRDGVVDIPQMRGLFDVMSSEGIDKGFFLTRGSFTEEARTFAHDHQIFAIDGKLFVAMIDHLPDAVRGRLLALVQEP